MILDNEAKLVTTVAFDLESVSNGVGTGTGQPLLVWAQLDAPGNLVITTGATSAAADALITVTVPAEGLEFRLPSDTKQFVKATFTATAPLGVFFVMEGNQTAT
ncbi:MAG: hypothetical protein DRJ03_11515 [Chloroflexi bacterium]|nr:MAG: hypothetical protein DRJ03_11515 [Chloroflexota bacterium]